MKKLVFNTQINASKEKVWFSLWDDENYENWTTVYCDGFYAVSSWEAGSKIYFLSPSGDGMYSKITSKKPFDSITFKHVGNLINFKEMPLDEETKLWTESDEHYSLTEENGITQLTITINSLDHYIAFYEGVIPKALEKIKAIAENPVIKSIAVRTTIEASIEKVWDFFTQPEHIIKWNFASDDWYCPTAENKFEVGGKFNYTMASKNEAIAFDLEGVYEQIETYKKIIYRLTDGRKIVVKFEILNSTVILTQIFEPENINAIDLQRKGWQAILVNFKKNMPA